MSACNSPLCPIREPHYHPDPQAAELAALRAKVAEMEMEIASDDAMIESIEEENETIRDERDAALAANAELKAEVERLTRIVKDAGIDPNSPFEMFEVVQLRSSLAAKEAEIARLKNTNQLLYEEKQREGQFAQEQSIKLAATQERLGEAGRLLGEGNCSYCGYVFRADPNKTAWGNGKCSAEHHHKAYTFLDSLRTKEGGK